MERVSLSDAARKYRSQTEERTTLGSTAAGATLGGVPGVVVGLIAGLRALVAVAGALADMTLVQSTAVTVLLGLAVGLFFSALFGTVLGTGIVQEDEFRYAVTLKPGQSFAVCPCRRRAARRSSADHERGKCAPLARGGERLSAPFLSIELRSTAAAPAHRTAFWRILRSSTS